MKAIQTRAYTQAAEVFEELQYIGDKMPDQEQLDYIACVIGYLKQVRGETRTDEETQMGNPKKPTTSSDAATLRWILENEMRDRRPCMEGQMIFEIAESLAKRLEREGYERRSMSMTREDQDVDDDQS